MSTDDDIDEAEALAAIERAEREEDEVRARDVKAREQELAEYRNARTRVRE